MAFDDDSSVRLPGDDPMVAADGPIAGEPLPSPRRAPGIGQKTATGFLWMAGQTIGTKVFNAIGQVLLAWFLDPRDFAIIGLAYMVLFFTGLARLSNLGDVLVHRHSSLRVWSNAAFWFSLTFSLLSAALAIIAAPVVSRFYGESSIFGLVLIMALLVPVDALTTVGAVSLRVQLRFKLVASIAALNQTLLMALTILFAAFGFGVYSFVWPRCIVSLVLLLVYWRFAPARIRWNPQIRRWRYLFASSARLLAADVANTFTYQGDYLLLGIFRPAPSPAVGLYFFAYNLSTQVTQLVATNMSSILMPALSKLQSEPERMAQAYFRACRAIGVVGIPLGLLQAATADAGIHAVFAPKWYPAVPLLQILSICMAIIVATRSGESLIKAVGRFNLHIGLSIASAAIFATLVTPGAWLWGAIGTAAAVTAALTIHGLLQMYCSFRIAGGGVRQMVLVFMPPLLASLGSIGTGYILSLLVPTMHFRSWVQIGIILACSLGYVPLIRMLARQTTDDLLARFRRKPAHA